MTFDSETISIDDDFEDVNDYLYQREMTDGFPVVPPTAERVERMLEGTSRKPDEELGTIPPKYGVATVEKIAINAVMAGCEPAYMPVLIAAVEAMTEEKFNLYGVNATTHPAAPMLVVNGPIVEEINLNYGYNVFGQGYRANATIGRTVRLLLVNLGGGTPGDMDRATHGHPGKYSFCIAENEKKNPWDPLHVQRGFDEDESAVTVMGVEAPHEINDHVNEKPAELLTVAADVFATVGNNNSHHTHGEICIVLGPEHADTIARNNWSREDVQWFLYDNARNELKTLQTAGITDNYTWHHRFEVENDDARIPLVETPEDVTVVVAGGAGKHSMALHSFGETRSITVGIDEEV